MKKILRLKSFVLFLAVLFLCTTRSSAQWIAQDAGFVGKTLGFYEISIVDENVVWAICYDGVNGLGGPIPILDFTRTTDGGTTWVPGEMGSDPTLAFSTISALSDNEAWVAMHMHNFSTGGGLFHTTDGGLTWAESNPGVVFDEGSFPNFVYFKDAMNGVAGGDTNGGYPEIYTTTDGGESWTRTPQANIPEPLEGGGYGWFNGHCVIGNTIWFGTNLGQVYKSTDLGLNWSIYTVDPEMNMVYEMAFNDDGLHGLTNIRTASNAVILFSTADGGETWTQMTQTPEWKRSRITSVPGTNTFVSTSVVSGNFGSSYTTDNGLSWTIIDSSVPKAACRFLNSSTGWAGSYFNDNPIGTIDDGLWKWGNSVPLEVGENSILSSSVFPNPVEDVLNIQVNSDFVLDDFQFYNSIGVKVKELVNSNGKSVDVSDLPPGIYFINSKNYPERNLKFKKL